MADLETLRDRVEALLTDGSNAEWTTAELDQAIRLALSDLGLSLPVRAVTSIDAVASQWEYSLAAVTGLVSVVEVWYPYLSTDESYKQPHPVRWRMVDDATLMVEPDDDPDAAYDLRVFYTKCQTLAGLDSAATTTLSEAEKSVLVQGSAAYAALGKSRDVTNEVTVGSEVVKNLREWGLAMLTKFQRSLDALSVIEAAGEDSRIGWGTMDRWDKNA